MQYFIYTTCGTSTFTNPARKDPELNDLIVKNSNARNEDELSPGAKEKIDAHYDSLIEEWQNYSITDARAKSAELNSLLSWQEKNNIPASECLCFLLHTDTVLGANAASLVEEWLTHHGYMSVQLQKIDSLSTSSLENFEKGLASLAEWAFANIPSPEHRSSNEKYVFNVAGGFKSVSGFMQILGQFLADETIYLFEGHSEILSMPHLPVRWEENETIRQNFDDYRRVSLGIPPKNLERLNSLWVRNGQFTPWGQIAWESAKQELYGEKVYSFIFEKVKEGPAFRSSISGLLKEQVAIVNERIDDLCRYIKGGKKQPLKRLDYKKIQGGGPYDYECDVWDGNSKRFFCTDKDGIVTIERFADAMHKNR